MAEQNSDQQNSDQQNSDQQNSDQQNSDQQNSDQQNSNQQNSNIQKPEDKKTNESNPKKLKVARPNNIIIDIYGVITSWEFPKELRTFIRDNLSIFLNLKWTQRIVTNIVNKLREQSDIDEKAGIHIPLIEVEEPNKSVEIVINSVVTNILWQIDNKHKASQKQLDSLFNLIWSDAYDTSRLKTHAFKDVKPALDHWRFVQFVKIYAYASGPPEGQRQFLRSSVEGDLTKFIANYINSSGGYKYDPNKFRAVLSVLRESDPKNLMYLTDEPKKARAAIQSSLRAVVVLRPGNPVYSEEELKGLDTITSFADLEFEEEAGNPAPCC